MPRTQFGKHPPLCEVSCPCWSQLKVRLINDRFPVPAPFKAQVLPQYANGFVLRGVWQVLIPFEYPNVKGDTEIVIRVSTSSVGDDVPWSGTALRIEGVLLLVCPQAAYDLDRNSRGRGLLHKCSGNRLYLR